VQQQVARACGGSGQRPAPLGLLPLAGTATLLAHRLGCVRCEMYVSGVRCEEWSESEGVREFDGVRRGWLRAGGWRRAGGLCLLAHSLTHSLTPSLTP
jgi:hypothetical protein